jgi:hypothetical protein
LSSTKAPVGSVGLSNQLLNFPARVRACLDQRCWSAQGSAGTLTAVVGVTWPFIGRQEELGHIHQSMSDAATPGIVIAGAAGVGKTRLGLEALASADPQRFLTRRVIATQATASIPFGALAQLLPAELPAAGDRVNVLGLAAKALVAPAGGRRLVLEVDDAHLLDDTSAALLYQLIRSQSTFVMVLVRSGEPAPEPIVALWKHDLVERLELQALLEPDVKAVLTTALGAQIDGATMQRLWRATGGNMLLLRELVVAGLDTGRLAKVEGGVVLGRPLGDGAAAGRADRGASGQVGRG